MDLTICMPIERWQQSRHKTRLGGVVWLFQVQQTSCIYDSPFGQLAGDKATLRRIWILQQEQQQKKQIQNKSEWKWGDERRETRPANPIWLQMCQFLWPRLSATAPALTITLSLPRASVDVHSELFYMAEGRWKSLRKMNDSLMSSALLCSGYTLYGIPDGAFTALPVTSGVKSRCLISISIPIRLQLRNCNKRQHESVVLI